MIAAAELEPAVDELRAALPLGEPYADPGVALFGLRNAVMALGDTFVEVISPMRDDAPAARFLAAHGGDGPYMLIFQLEDLAAARARLPELEVRVAWEIDLPDISAVHLHPRDVPGAIVSLDRPDPPESWRWGGPDWRPEGPGCVVGAEIAAPEPERARERWAAVLGVAPEMAGITFVAGQRAQVTCFDLHVPGRDGAEFELSGTRIRCRG